MLPYDLVLLVFSIGFKKQAGFKPIEGGLLLEIFFLPIPVTDQQSAF